jgi:hypothetical protein
VTAFPSATTITNGTYRSGSAASLNAVDGATYQVSTSVSRTDWYGRITGVPNSLRSLTMTFNGSSSVTCTQRLMLYNWTSATWAMINSRTAGTTAVSVVVPVAGTLANYVSGSTGYGDVYARVQCVSAMLTFFSSADLLQITYGT